MGYNFEKTENHDCSFTTQIRTFTTQIDTFIKKTENRGYPTTKNGINSKTFYFIVLLK